MKRYEIYSSFGGFETFMNGLIESLNMSLFEVDTPRGNLPTRKCLQENGWGPRNQRSKRSFEKKSHFWHFLEVWTEMELTVTFSICLSVTQLIPVESHSSIDNFQWLHLNDCCWQGFVLIRSDLITKQVGCWVACDHSLPNISLAVPWKRTPQFCSSMPH